MKLSTVFYAILILMQNKLLKIWMMFFIAYRAFLIV